MKCFTCNASVDDGPLFRTNAKGEAGVFACAAHRPKFVWTPFRVWLLNKAREERQAEREQGRNVVLGTEPTIEGD